MYEIAKKFLGQHERDCSELKESLADLGQKIESDYGPQVPKELHKSHIQLFQQTVKGVSQRGVTKKTGLPEETKEKVKNKKEEIIQDAENYFVPYSGKSLADLEITKDLMHAGMITLSPKQDALTFFITPTSIPLGLYFLYKNSLRDHQKICEVTAALREEKVDEDKIEERAKSLEKNIGQQLDQWVDKNQLGNLPKYDLQVSDFMESRFLPNSNYFYHEGQEFYEGSLENYNVFATTTGLILPDEHFGANYFTGEVDGGLNCEKLASMSDKNPRREDYFGVLKDAAKNKPVNYFFDKKRSKKKMRDTLGEITTGMQRKKYKEDAKKILSEYLSCGKLNFLEIPNGIPKDFQFFTLTNSTTILISQRPGEDQSIGHGVRAKLKDTWPRLKEDMKETSSDVSLPDLAAPLWTLLGHLSYRAFNKRINNFEDVNELILNFLQDEKIIGGYASVFFTALILRFIKPHIVAGYRSIRTTRRTKKTWKTQIEEIADNFRVKLEEEYNTGTIINYSQKDKNPKKIANDLVEELSGAY